VTRVFISRNEEAPRGNLCVLHDGNAFSKERIIVKGGRGGRLGTALIHMPVASNVSIINDILTSLTGERPALSGIPTWEVKSRRMIFADSETDSRRSPVHSRSSREPT